LQVQCIPGMHRRTSVDTTMKNADCTKVGLIGCVLCGLIAPAPAAERRAPDALARYVPGDAFVIFGYTSTPEREFVDQHWSRVYRALEASNIGRELHAAIALSIPEKDRAEFDATWQRMTDLFGAVQWCDLIANDLVFAERIVGLFPDWFFIMRPEAATLDHNEKGPRRNPPDCRRPRNRGQSHILPEGRRRGFDEHARRARRAHRVVRDAQGRGARRRRGSARA
jgi:hypothetical protein